MIKKAAVLFCVFSLLLMCGCGGYRESDQGYFVTAMGFGPCNEGYNLSLEVVYSSQSEENIKRDVLISKGATPQIAFASLNSSLTRELYLDHCGVLMIEESFTPDAVKDTVEFYRELKGLSLSAFIATVSSVEEILQIESVSGNIGFDIMALMKRLRKGKGKNFSNRIYETVNQTSKGEDFVWPYITASQQKILFSGERIYENYRYKGQTEV